MKIRKYVEIDTYKLLNLFRETVRTVCKLDYTPDQLRIWAQASTDNGEWRKRFLESFTLVAEEKGLVLGFANLNKDGLVDMLYVNANEQRKGVGKALMESLEAQAKQMKLGYLTSDVSITAKPFFLRMGFKIEHEYDKHIRGCIFRNTLMSKALK